MKLTESNLTLRDFATEKSKAMADGLSDVLRLPPKPGPCQYSLYIYM